MASHCPKSPWPRHGQSLPKVAMATPWPKAAMANGFGAVEYIEISKVTMALPWPAIAQSCHGPAMASHRPKSPWPRHGQPLPKVAMAGPRQLWRFLYIPSISMDKSVYFRLGEVLQTLSRNLQSRHGPAMASHRQSHHGAAMASHCPKSPWPRHGQKWPWPMDLEGWNLKISKVAMAPPWPAIAQSRHGHAMAKSGHGQWIWRGGI